MKGKKATKRAAGLRDLHLRAKFDKATKALRVFVDRLEDFTAEFCRDSLNADLKNRLDEELLCKAVQRFIESKGGKVLVVGGISIQQWPQDNTHVYHVAVKFMGRPPKIAVKVAKGPPGSWIRKGTGGGSNGRRTARGPDFR